MESNTNQVQELSVKTLLSNSGEYTIPVYQRNYAWEEPQIRQLIKDVMDSLKKNKHKKYYIGTLIVDKTIIKNRKLLETIDGQQRLTTLNIILIALKNHPNFGNIKVQWFDRLNLSFSNRKKSQDTLTDLFTDSILEDSKDYSEPIRHAYRLVASILKVELKENNIEEKDFADYLFENVSVLRVEVPPLTDLNHYFEIMNNRGEQLEKHEVLKARLLDAFNLIENEEEKKKCSHVFHTIWEACANMEKYVQYGFDTKTRHYIFDKTSWDNLCVNDFDDLCDCFGPLSVNDNEEEKSIDEIIQGARFENKSKIRDENPERFYSIINFSNFLLHVLRIHTGKDILLDDKNLLNTFENLFDKDTPNEEKIKFSKDFGFALLKLKYLFDKFILKRDASKEDEEWSLLKMKNSKQGKGKGASYTASYPNTFEETKLNKNAVQLLSMLHVSVPTLSYKHWLNGALKYVYETDRVDAESYVSFLEEIAKQFVFNRVVAKVPQEYYDMIYNPTSINNIEWTKHNSTIDESKFNFGEITNNLLFNYVDYLLWKRSLSQEDVDNRVADFKFTSRSSVEHFYPQNPKDGFPKLSNENTLHCFGNLCLISHSKNSSLSNFPPYSKADFYLKKEDDIDSIKQYIMLQRARKWDEDSIKKHHSEMMELLKKASNEK